MKYEYGTVICACGCGEVIPPVQVHAQAHHGVPPRFLNRRHFGKWRKETGFYTLKLSPAGLQAQKELQEKLGHRPGHEKRSAGVSESNKRRRGRAKQKSEAKMKKHGKYDAEKKLPDNRMQPQGSGLNVWLQEEIIARLGEDQAQQLIEQASQHKAGRYAYMLGIMTERGHADLAEEYHKRKLEDEAERRVRDKERLLRQFKEQAEKETSADRTVWLRKQILKIEDYLRESEQDVQRDQFRH